MSTYLQLVDATANEFDPGAGYPNIAQGYSTKVDDPAAVTYILTQAKASGVLLLSTPAPLFPLWPGSSAPNTVPYAVLYQKVQDALGPLNAVLFSAGQGLSGPQQAAARANIGAAGLADSNQFLKTNFFNGPSVPGQSFTGMAADFSGALDDVSGALNRQPTRRSMAITVTGGTNGSRGDSVTSVVANGDGTQFLGDWIGTAAAFTGKGSISAYVYQGHMGAHASGAYGEMGGVLPQITNDRPGALIEGIEAVIYNNQQAKVSAATLILADNAGIAGLAAYNWSRALWILSAGSSRAGDAVYIEGASGFDNFLHFMGDDGLAKLTADHLGNLTLKGATVSDELASYTDPSVFLYFGNGSPNGVTTAGKGSLYIDRGTGATWSKVIGTGNTGWALLQTLAGVGTAVLVAGTKVVTDTNITANSIIRCSQYILSGGVGIPFVSAKSAGASFTILSSSNTDTSTVYYEILKY